MKNITYHCNEDSEVVYANTFGTVFSENFTIHPLENRAINLDNNLRKVKLVKQRQYRKNFIFFTLALVTTIFLYINKDNKAIFIFAGMLTVSMVFLSLLIVEYQFKFILLRKYDSTIYAIDRRYSDDAQQLALLVNKKIRNNDKHSNVLKSN